MKNFLIFTEPHIADPELIAPVYEKNADGTTKQYSDGSPLLEAYFMLRDQIARANGREQGIKDVLEVLGLTYDDYIKKATEFSKKGD